MLTINLLAPEKRRESTINIFYHPTKTVLEVALFFALLIAIAVLGMKLFLVRVALDTAGSSQLHPNIHTEERAVRDMNQNITLLEDLDRSTIPWSQALLALADAAPSAIRLTDMSIIGSGKIPKLHISGYAATRDDLLAWKTALESLPFLSDLNFPLTNLLSPKDIEWRVEAAINRSAFLPAS